jgi:hypothetical protein
VETFQRRAEAALVNLRQQGLVAGVRTWPDGRRRVEVLVSIRTDETAPDFDRAEFENACRRIGAALHGVEWVIVPASEP